MCLLAIYISSLKKCLFNSLAHFLIRLYFFLVVVCYLCICILSWSDISFTAIFFHSVDCLFILLISFATRRVITWCISFVYLFSSFFSLKFSSVQLLSRVWLCNPMNRSTSGVPVHHQLPGYTQIHVHSVGDAIQPSHPLLSTSPHALNFSQHQGLFQWVSSSHQVAKVLQFQLQQQSFQWTPMTDVL